ncbi:unnamed protein product [Amoebophrya sp. A120]|nr:unnamed protein product [Amoebophrya sp. A120]|eukprot:GSA120T00011509001.1
MSWFSCGVFIRNGPRSSPFRSLVATSTIAPAAYQAVPAPLTRKLLWPGAATLVPVAATRASSAVVFPSVSSCRWINSMKDFRRKWKKKMASGKINNKWGRRNGGNGNVRSEYGAH